MEKINHIDITGVVQAFDFNTGSLTATFKVKDFFIIDKALHFSLEPNETLGQITTSDYFFELNVEINSEKLAQPLILSLDFNLNCFGSDLFKILPTKDIADLNIFINNLQLNDKLQDTLKNAHPQAGRLGSPKI